MEPILCVVDRKSDKILHQVFNFFDAIGGKTSITADNIEKYFLVRGVLAGNHQELTKNKKDRQVRQFVTESFFEAGAEFDLDNTQLDKVAAQLAEMDAVNVIELDPAKIKYAEGLVQVFRDVEDPFNKELGEIKFKSAQGAGPGEMAAN